MSGNINGLDKLMKMYGTLFNTVVGQSMERAVGASAHIVQAEAKLMCPVNDGELRQSIKTSVTKQDGKVIGTAYTNKKYVPYVELGTGPKGEADHAGISPEVSPSYTQSPWWIHESKVDKEVADKYHWFSIETSRGRFYQCTGQPASPFMYPALERDMIWSVRCTRLIIVECRNRQSSKPVKRVLNNKAHHNRWAAIIMIILSMYL